MLESYSKNALNCGFSLNKLHFVLITEDFCNKRAMVSALHSNGLTGDVFNWRDREEWMKNAGVERYLGLIPRRSHAETSFGLLWLLANEDYEYGIFIDDDTYPTDDDFFGRHISNIETKDPCLTLTSSTRWINVLHSSFEKHALYPRGYPYRKWGNNTRTATLLPRK